MEEQIEELNQLKQKIENKRNLNYQRYMHDFIEKQEASSGDEFMDVDGIDTEKR